jgi:hypothetical protein
MPSLPVRSGPSATLDRLFESLSPRDRKLAAGLVGSVGLAFVVLFAYGAYSVLASKSAHVRSVKEALVQMQQAQIDYRQAEATFSAHEERLRDKEPLSAFLESLAEKHQISDELKNINAQGQPELVGTLSQQRYTVEIKKAPQENIFRFLHDLETSGYPASVEQASFKGQATKEGNMMNLTLELVVLSVGDS